MAKPPPSPPDHHTRPACAGCRQRDDRIAQLERELARRDACNTQLERQLKRRDARIAQLQERLQGRGLQRNACNSSLPPSANPPQAPKPVVKKPTGRKPGGQPGHPGHTRPRLPPERLQHVIAFVPDTCKHCQAPLPAQAGPNDPKPTWLQYAELPKLAAVVTEYQGHARTCPRCAGLTRAVIPEQLHGPCLGPRLAAALSYLSGSPHVSKRGVEEIVETVFQVPIALGTVAKLEQEMSAALQRAHAEAQQAVQQAPVKHVDETGWKEAGAKRWLWAAATASVVCFVIHPSRGFQGLLALLANKLKGLFISDRWSAYHRLPVARRQVCWAHLKRDFQKLVDRGGVSAPFGQRGLATVRVLFHWWHAFRGGSITRRELQRRLGPERRRLKRWLGQGARCRVAKTATFCQNLLDLEPALWTFLDRRGVEPTNNLVERLVRSAVLWRKMAFGCHSEAGCRFVERILTVVGTLRLQKRPVLEFLEQSLRAHRDGRRAPKLLKRR